MIHNHSHKHASLLDSPLNVLVMEHPGVSWPWPCPQVFSAGAEHLAVLAYVPEEKQAELVCEARGRSRFHMGKDQPPGVDMGFSKDPNSWKVYFMEDPFKMDDSGVPPFQETSILAIFEVMQDVFLVAYWPTKWGWYGMKQYPADGCCMGYVTAVLVSIGLYDLESR